MIGLALWALVLGLNLWGTYLALKKSRPHDRDLNPSWPPLSVLKPLKGLEPGLESQLEIFLQQDYPDYEVLFCVQSSSDPVIDLVHRLLEKHPQAQARLMIGEGFVGVNPKINNLQKAYDFAKHDLLLVSDANVIVPRDYLKRLVVDLDDDVGVVTAPVVARASSKSLGAALDAMCLNTFVLRFLTMANAAGLPCVLGKSMLFRRSVAERFGGLKTLGSFLAEDYMMGYGVRALGLRIKLSSNLLYQNVDGITLKGFWNRHLRWAKMRKVMSPIWFKLEPFSGAILQGSFIGWLSTNALSISIPSILIIHLTISWALDSILILRVEGRLSLKHLIIWLCREILSFGIWIQALFDNSIEWKGSRFKLQPGGLVTR